MQHTEDRFRRCDEVHHARGSSLALPSLSYDEAKADYGSWGGTVVRLLVVVDLRD